MFDIYFGFILVCFSLKGAFSIQCYECHRIPYPRDCQYIRDCGDGEACVTKQVVTSTGLIFYYTGCQSIARCSQKRSAATNFTDHKLMIANDETHDVQTCDECCHSDYCNNGGCRSQELPGRSSRGPVCFSCPQSIGTDTCDMVAVCDQGEMCYLGRNHYGSGDNLYEARCVPTSACDVHISAPPVVGKRQSACTGCCDTDYCNRNCSALTYHSSGPLPTHPIMTPTTPKRTTPLPTQPPAELFCNEHGFKYDGFLGRCINIVSNALAVFEQASLRCFHQGGSLIRFHNTSEMEHVANLVKDIKPMIDYWVGASDLQTEGQWQWTDGTSVDKDFFHPSQPDNAYFYEDCATLNSWTVDTFIRLNDVNCTATRANYICEKSVPGMSNNYGEKTDEALCRNMGYTYLEGVNLCFKIDRGQQKNWAQARHQCINDGGDLINLKSGNDETFVSLFIQTLTDHSLDRVWVGATDSLSEGSWFWEDGTPVQKDLFAPWEPNNHNGEDCGDLVIFSSIVPQTMHLNDIPCSTGLHFVCELDLQGLHALSVQPGAPSPCRNSNYEVIPGTSLCYRIRNDMTANFEKARNMCQQDGGDLLMLRDRVMEDYFLNLNLNDHDETHRYILGAIRMGEAIVPSSFSWLDNRPVQSLQWIDGEPNNYNQLERCLSISYINGQRVNFALNDINCAEEFFFICEEKCSSPDYKYVPALDLCINIHTERRAWSGAYTSCQNEGGKLLEITSQSVHDFMKHYLKGFYTMFDSLWLGGRFSTSNGTFHWITAVGEIPKSFWSGNNPPSPLQQDACVAFVSNNQHYTKQLGSLECSSASRYICQKQSLS